MTLQNHLAVAGSAPFLQTVLDALTAGIVILDKDGVIIATNASWRRFGDENGLAWTDYGMGRNYLATMDLAEGDQSLDARVAAVGIRQVMAGQRESFSLEYPCDSPDEERWYIMWVTPLEPAGGGGVVIAHEEITARKLSEFAAEAARRAETQQRRIAERRRAIAAGLGDALGILNSDRPLQDVLGYIVELAHRLLGARTVALLEAGGSEPLCVRTSGAGDASLSSALCGRIWERLARDGAGQEILLLDSAMLGGTQAGTVLVAPIRVQGEAYGVLFVDYARPRTMLQEEVELVRDVAIQISLAVGNAYLRERVESQAIAAERSRMLRELHDSVSQALFSANLIADALPRLWEHHPEQARQGLQELTRLTRTAHADIRSLLLDLGPSAVTQEPLGVLLHRLADSVSSRSGLPIQERVDATLDLPVAAKIALYRIAEEALNNAIKHARPTELQIALEPADGGVQLAVIDDGIGFAPDVIPVGRLGLGIMRERAESIGADLDVVSEPGRGTRIAVAWVPEKGSMT